jgi:cytochrome c-type biogenesis protein CcmH
VSTTSRTRRWNRSVKRWPGWAALLIVLVGLFAVGVTRDAGPRSPGDRVDDISRRLACPVCDGESVFESRNNASDSIRSEITAQVGDGARTDDEIIEFIADRFGAQVLLVPRSSGIEALAWAIPAAALVCGVAGLAVAFRRWRLDAAERHGATDQDYALVDAALAEFDAEHRAVPPPGDHP